MPTVRPQLINDEIYHVVVRGVSGTEIFKNPNDYYRGIFSIYEFNNSQLITIQKKREARGRFKKKLGGDTIPTAFVDERDKMVDVLAFCFMSNHIHLLLKQVADRGISQFMKKLGAGYAGYFNKKYSREGHLFQGRFKVVHVESDDQLKNVFVYIHANPISLIEPGWKERGINNSEKVIEFLENYKWSSYQDYIGKNNFTSVTNRKFLTEVMGGIDNCKGAINDWVAYKKGLKDLGNIVLE